MTTADHPDIRTTLDSMRQRIERHLVGGSRYRALLAIDKTISDLADHADLAQPLRDVRDQIRLQLNETREYRVLCAVDRIGPELIDILAFLDEEPRDGDASLRREDDNPDQEGPVAETHTEAHIVVDVYSRADAIEHPSATKEVEPAGGAAGPVRAGDTTRDSPIAVSPEEFGTSSGSTSGDMSEAFHGSSSSVPDLVDRIPQDADDASYDPASPPVATLAYNLANMLVQSLPPGQTDSAATSDSRSDTELESDTNADQTMREGRAA